MKKFRFAIAVIATLSLAAFALFGCSSGSNASSQDASTASSKAKELIIGFDVDFPPYGFVAEDGTYAGFDIDLAAATAEANGWHFEAKAINWDERDAELESGNITCIWNGMTMEGREGLYAFTEPYMINEQVVVTKSHSSIKSFEDLAGKRVATQEASSTLDVLNGAQANLTSTFDGGTVLITDDLNGAFLLLDSGKADAVACDLSFAAYQLSRSGDKYQLLDEPLSVEHFAVGFKLGDEETAKIVTNTLKVLYEEGIVEQLCEKYEDDGISFINWVLK